MARKAGRPRTGYERLSRERILGTALQLVDRHGMEALSMRRLAAELGVDPMAIYHHVPGKEALLEGVAQLAFAQLRVEPPAGADWREQVRAFARGYRDMVREHPHLTLLLIANVQAGGAALLRATERLCAALEESGLPPGLVATAAAVIVDYVHGFTLAEGMSLRDQRTSPPGAGRDIIALLKRHPELPVPALRRALASADAPAGDTAPGAAGSPVGSTDPGASGLERGLDVLLAGIEAMVACGASSGADQPRGQPPGEAAAET